MEIALTVKRTDDWSAGDQTDKAGDDTWSEQVTMNHADVVATNELKQSE